jgi:LPS O-antigen subunit length determinant protein (WzzB/FepE family)
MKKNNIYLADDEINLGRLIKQIYREKILILSISIICGLLAYLYASFKPEEFKTEIKLKNPPSQLFEPYTYLFKNNNNFINNNNNFINNNNNNNNIVEQFISDFKLNFLSLDNLEIFVEESRDLDSFKKYLKSRNISTRNYFVNKFGVVKETNIIIPNTYFLVFEKNLDVDVFIKNYAEFTKKKSLTELKKNLKLTIENRINYHELHMETAKLINLEDPILKLPDRQNQLVNEPDALFYKGTKVLSQSIIFDKKLLQKLENDQFNYNLILDKASPPVLQNAAVSLFFVSGLILGFLLSLVIIFLRNTLKEKL